MGFCQVMLYTGYKVKPDVHTHSGVQINLALVQNRLNYAAVSKV